jgi:hypothetical protein
VETSFLTDKNELDELDGQERENHEDGLPRSTKVISRGALITRAALGVVAVPVLSVQSVASVLSVLKTVHSVR